MGLDMYLYARKYISKTKYVPHEGRLVETEDEDYGKLDEAYESAFPKGLDRFAEYHGRTIQTEIAYWRKANQIHNWFVLNVQDGKDDCEAYYVSREDLEALLEDVDKVLETVGTDQFEQTAEEILPTEQGFFFGNYDYDEYYIEQLEHTKQVVEHVLACFNEGNFGVYYRASW